MHFHLPKPLHGWREFIGEVGIVVLGILIALGGEQVVEHFRHKAEVREAEDAMIAELRDDNLPQAYTRAANFNCYADQLDAIEAALAAGDRGRFEKLSAAYRPVVRTWDDEAWKAAMASQVLVHSGAKRMTGWASPYVMIPKLAQGAEDEQAELPYLWAKQSGTGDLSSEQQDRLFQVIALLKRYNRRMASASLVLMRQEEKQGLTLTKQEKQSLLADSRELYGACVREPAPEVLDLSSQFASTKDAFGGR